MVKVNVGYKKLIVEIIVVAVIITTLFIPMLPIKTNTETVYKSIIQVLFRCY